MEGTSNCPPPQTTGISECRPPCTNTVLPGPGPPRTERMREQTESAPLTDDLRNHPRRILIRQPFLQSVAVDKQFAVVQTELMENGRVQIVDADPVFRRLESDLVGRAVNHAAFGAASGHPDAEPVRPMIASRRFRRPLRNRQAPEL